MFSPIRLLCLGYSAGLSALVIVLAAPGASRGQRAPIAPLLGSTTTLLQSSQQQALAMLQSGGIGGGLGGFGISAGGFNSFGGGFNGNLTGIGGFGGLGGGFNGGGFNGGGGF